MNNVKKITEIIDQLKIIYPDARCFLFAGNAFELLVAARLSAQCTDKMVNRVTPTLFAAYKNAEEFSTASPENVEKIIRPCGLYKTKARDIIAMSKKIVSDFHGEVPDTMDDLLSLPGVGRKIANLILGDVYGKPAVVCDTHLIRITNRLGLVNTKNPQIIEKQLKAILPPEESNAFCHRIVQFGRDTCTAKSPKCSVCPLNDLCENKNENNP